MADRNTTDTRPAAGYSYYATQTARTLRGFLGAGGATITSWASSPWNNGGAQANADDEALRSTADNRRQEGGLADLAAASRHVGNSKKTSRPAIERLFADNQGANASTALDQPPATKLATNLQRHNRSYDRQVSPSCTFDINKVLFHAGTSPDPYDDGAAGSPDKTSGGDELPMLVLCPCNLPTELSDIVVKQLTSRLDSYAQEPYLLVLFASPSRPVPVQHLVRYYRLLSSEARRNVRRLWICHAGLFTKIAVKLFLNTIVSGKVTRKGKVRLVDSLADLAKDLKISQIEIPPDVLLHNAKVSNSKVSAVIKSQPVFGVPLKDCMKQGSKQLPRPIQDGITFLRTQNNLQTSGLFRKVPNLAVLDVLREAYDTGYPITLQDWPEANILAGSLIKTFFRLMVYPVFPAFMYERIRRCPSPRARADNGDDLGDSGNDKRAVEYIREVLLPALVDEHPDGEAVVYLLREVLRLLKDVAQSSDTNKMNSHNLAVVFLPVLVQSANILEDVEICTMPSARTRSATQTGQKKNDTSLGMIIKLMIERFDDVFLSTVTDSNEPVSQTMTPDSSHSFSSTSSAEPRTPYSRHKTMRRNSSTLKLLAGSPRTVKRGGQTTRAEASRESVRGLFAGP